MTERLPDFLWSPQDRWAAWKGYGRIVGAVGVAVLIGGLAFDLDVLVVEFSVFVLLVAGTLYAIGLLGMRKAMEKRRKGNLIAREDVRMALDHVDAAAREHGADYRAGMREARRIVETELLD